ncbi:MAG: glutamate--tRNA ligase [Candidatus Woykebacteria bacterium]
MSVRVRIAPSPTGEPHIGTAYTALFNFAFAKQEKGKFILRIEDTDQTRLVQDAEKKIIEALKWLGLSWDEGPDVGGPRGPYRQTERLETYQEYARELVNAGKAYFCDCSPERLKRLRDEQQSRKEVPRYDGKCRARILKEGPNIVARLSVPEEGVTSFRDQVRGEITFQNKDIDDTIILKSDKFPTYHLASVVDDHIMEITHVIRAEEWLSSTPKHVLLYQAFGWELPTFVHLPLLRNPDRSKISKRKNPISLTWYREQGYLPEALLNYLATMGWSMPGDKEIFTLEEFIKNFDFGRIDTTGPIFDTQKLDWMNGEYIRKMSYGELVQRLKEFTKVKKEDIARVLPLVKERMKKLSEFDGLTSFIFKEEISPEFSEIVKNYANKVKAEALERVVEALQKTADWNTHSIEKALESAREKLKWSKSDLYMLTRVAISGSSTTPPLFETMEAVGRDKVIDRLRGGSRRLLK